MRTRRFPLGAVLVVFTAVAVLTGCSSRESHVTADSRARGSSNVAALDSQAKAAVAAWEPVLAARAGAPFLLKSDSPSQVVDPGSSAIDARFKTDWAGGRFTTDRPLPATAPSPATIDWPGGGTAAIPLISPAAALHGLQQPIAKSCPSCTDTPLLVRSATLGSVSAMSSRGPVQIPAWIFGFADYDVKIAYPAIAPTASVFASNAPQGVSSDFRASQAVTVSADQRTLTVSFDGGPDTPGACGSEVSGHAFEAAHVVAIVTVEKLHSESANCPLTRQRRTVTIHLAAPLAGRVVLGLAGMPLAIG